MFDYITSSLNGSPKIIKPTIIIVWGKLSPAFESFQLVNLYNIFYLLLNFN